MIIKQAIWNICTGKEGRTPDFNTLSIMFEMAVTDPRFSKVDEGAYESSELGITITAKYMPDHGIFMYVLQESGND